MPTINLQKLKIYSLKDNTLRDYQQDNKQKIYDAWEHKNTVMLQMPTGTGKTRLFVSIIKDLFRYGRDNKVALKILILVHRSELIDQIDEELGYRYNLAHGIIKSGEKERKIYPIQLASVQTLSRRLDNWGDKEFDFIIVDEAHHVKAASYQIIISTFPHAKLLGVTATPVRLNGHGFTDTFEELIVSPSIKQFIDKGYLNQYEYYSVRRSSLIQKEIDGIKKFSQGDYAESELVRICDNDCIRAQVVETYLDFANGKKGIVYTINKEHNKNLCEDFNAQGVKAVAIDSDTPRETREQYIKQFRRGDIKIICNVNLFTEGFDCPDIEFIQLARPTKSLALYLQQVGRGLRFSVSKEKTLFLDNVGLYNRFGFPSSKRIWRHHFEGKYHDYKKEKETKEIKDKETTTVITGKRMRHQNLEEGNEKVHLIQTTEEKAYLEKRAEELKNWIINVFECLTIAYNQAFDEVVVDGLSLTSEINEKYFYFCYHICMEKVTPALETMLKTRQFHFDRFDHDKYINEGYRKCKDFTELIEKYDEIFQIQKRRCLDKDLKVLTESYRQLHFNKSELDDIVADMMEEKWGLICNIENEPMHFARIVNELFVDCFFFNESGRKTLKPLCDSIEQNF